MEDFVERAKSDFYETDLGDFYMELVEDLNASAMASNKNADDASVLLKALWRSKHLSSYIGVIDSNKNIFEQTPVAGVEEAVRKVKELSRQGVDCYFSVAQYASHDSRQAWNVECSHAFWFDIDCGSGKELKGQGYRDAESARSALDSFCRDALIPEPTHIVCSGGGLHVYWTLSESLDARQWRDSAQKFKHVAESLGMLADKSRTADIASVLRMPQTMNHKYDPPALVTLESAVSTPINREAMLGAIDAAYKKYCADVKSVSVNQEEKDDYGPPDLEELRSALACLTPDCDESTWTLRRLAPMARAAGKHPDMETELRSLAEEWSSGELRKVACSAWTTPGQSNGKTGQQQFDPVWERFVGDSRSCGEATLGTVFHDAKAEGWSRVVNSASTRGIRGEEISTKLSEAEAQQLTTEVIERAKAGDCGAPFEPEMLSYMAELHRTNQAESQRLRAQLKEANKRISLVSLDRAVRSRGKTEKATAPTHHGYAMDALDCLTVDGHRAVTYQGVLYVVDASSGLWIEHPMSALEREITKRNDGKENCTRRIDYKSIADQAVSTSDDPSFFATVPVGIACNGQFFSVQGDQIRDEQLQPEHRQRVMLDFEPAATPTPLFSSFLHDTFKSPVPGEEEEQIRLIQEIAGAVMMGVMARYQKAAFWYDPYGRAGKGTLQSIFEKLVPKEFVTAVSPIHWSKEYYVVTLAGARLNVVGELPDDVPIPAADFKSVLGGDLITGRNPAHRPISFKNEAAHLFMSNHMIPTREHSEGFYSRWLMVEFPNSRLKSGESLDPMLASRIVSQEMPGIAHWALEGAKRLLAQDKFSESKVHDRLMAKWRRSSSSLEEFIHECCDLDSGLKVKRSALYVAYVDWCAENGRKPYAKSKVKTLLEHNVKHNITLTSLDGYEIFRGIGIKSQVIAEGNRALDEALAEFG